MSATFRCFMALMTAHLLANNQVLSDTPFQAGVKFPLCLCSVRFLQLQECPCLLQKLAHHSRGTKHINIRRGLPSEVRPIIFAMYSQSSEFKVPVRTDRGLRTLSLVSKISVIKPISFLKWKLDKVASSIRTKLKLSSICCLSCRPLAHWSDLLDKPESKSPWEWSSLSESHFCYSLPSLHFNFAFGYVLWFEGNTLLKR